MKPRVSFSEPYTGEYGLDCIKVFLNKDQIADLELDDGRTVKEGVWIGRPLGSDWEILLDIQEPNIHLAKREARRLIYSCVMPRNEFLEMIAKRRKAAKKRKATIESQRLKLF